MKKQGFTLIELLIVIAIIAILAAVLIPNLLAARQRANDSATQSWIRNCVTAVETKRDPTTGALPTATTGCAALTGQPVPSSVDPATPGTVTYNASTDSYTINAKSKSGTSFTYNGVSIVSP